MSMNVLSIDIQAYCPSLNEPIHCSIEDDLINQQLRQKQQKTTLLASLAPLMLSLQAIEEHLQIKEPDSPLWGRRELRLESNVSNFTFTCPMPLATEPVSSTNHKLEENSNMQLSSSKFKTVVERSAHCTNPYTAGIVQSTDVSMMRESSEKALRLNQELTNQNKRNTEGIMRKSHCSNNSTKSGNRSNLTRKSPNRGKQELSKLMNRIAAQM